MTAPAIGPHVIPTHLFSALARGDGGQEAATLLAAAEQSRQILLVKGTVDAASALRHPDAGMAAEGYRLLALVDRLDRGAAHTVLQHPSVRFWASSTIAALREGRIRDAAVGHLASVAAAAAIRSRVTCRIRIRPSPAPGPSAEIVLPTLGRATVPDARPDGSLDLHHSDGTVRISGTSRAVTIQRLSVEGPAWDMLRELTSTANGHTVRLLFDDLDPYRFASGIGLAGHRPVADIPGWQNALDEAWTLLTAIHPTTAAEVATLVTCLTPLRDIGASDLSATTRAASGAVALTPPRDGAALALTLAHETQHIKLAALMDLCTLLRPDETRLYYAPWRNDPRPAYGLFQGAYAHLGIAGFWLRQSRSADDVSAVLAAQTEFVRWRDAAESAIRSLTDAAEFTDHGRRFATDMIQRLRSWQRESVQESAVRAAYEVAEKHRREWQVTMARHTQEHRFDRTSESIRALSE